MAALARHVEDITWFGISGFYLFFVFIGYYGLLLLFVSSVLFLVTGGIRRLAWGIAGSIFGLTLFYLVINSVVHRVYRLHIDAFWIQYMMESFGGIGIPRWMIVTAAALAVAIGLLEWGLFRIARHLRHRGRITAGFAVLTVLAFATSQVIHLVAYEKNDSRITGVTPQIPFYFPIVSHGEAVKYGGMLTMIGESKADSTGESSTSLYYPLHDVSTAVPSGKKLPNVLMIVLESWRADTMTETVSPNIHALALRSSWFQNHFSSGNSTPTGIFSLFYGIHPTYWSAVKANSAAIHNPVLIDAFEDNHYAFGIFADSHFERHKIKDGMFRGIEVHESFAGTSADQKDQDMTDQLWSFIQQSSQQGTPFFGFAFYKSTHFSYYYPRDRAHFVPTHKLNIALASADRDPSLFMNDYKNSVAYDDSLIGVLIGHLETSGILDNTIVIVTSDHGEEFNDNGANYWGHTGNFTEYQTRVPMVIYVPWEKPRQVTKVTAHIDIPPTILVEGLGCATNVKDYSNGVNLFGPIPAERPLVISSYVNHAVVVADDVMVVFPMYVQKYKLNDIKAKAGLPPADRSQEAMIEMNRFFHSDQ